jgi:hypothetical protein
LNADFRLPIADFGKPTGSLQVTGHEPHRLGVPASARASIALGAGEFAPALGFLFLPLRGSTFSRLKAELQTGAPIADFEIANRKLQI